MKFGKRLRMQIEDTLPEWRNKFLSYKELKKRLKSLAAPECFTEAACEASTNPEEDSSLGGPAETNADSLRNGDQEVETPQTETGEVPKAASPPVDKDSSRQVHSSDAQMRNGPEQAQPAETTVPASYGVQASGQSPGPPDEREPGKGLRSSPSPSPLIRGPSDGQGRRITKEEEEFIRLLNNELEKFNNFFIEKEEEYVIRLQELKERIDKVSDESGGRLVFRGTECTEEVLSIRREIVAFHGEMVLLENYSSLNYMGLVKILKKHDKRMGTVLRLPFIQTVLHQPFYTTELLSKLVRECEAKLRIVFPPPHEGEEASVQMVPGLGTTGETAEQGPAAAAPSMPTAVDSRQGAGPDPVPLPEQVVADEDELALPRGEDVDHIYRSTLAALKTLQEMRGNIGAAAAASRDAEDGNGSGVSSLTKAGETTIGGDEEAQRGQQETHIPDEEVRGYENLAAPLMMDVGSGEQGGMTGGLPGGDPPGSGRLAEELRSGNAGDRHYSEPNGILQRAASSSEDPMLGNPTEGGKRKRKDFEGGDDTARL